jgi:hypothetical protein
MSSGFIAEVTECRILVISRLLTSILWVTESHEIKDHIQEHQNTPLQNIN